MANRRIKPQVNVCRWCGKSFETGGRGRPAKNRRYCSLRCAAFGRIRTPVTNSMSDTEAAYLAGLFDGEGSVIAVNRNTKRISWRLNLANTFIPVLEWCVKTTGVGTIVYKPTYSETHTPCASWQCYSWNANDVLKQMLPYLIIKKEKAMPVIEEFNELVRRAAG